MVDWISQGYSCLCAFVVFERWHRPSGRRLNPPSLHNPITYNPSPHAPSESPSEVCNVQTRLRRACKKSEETSEILQHRPSNKEFLDKGDKVVNGNPLSTLRMHGARVGPVRSGSEGPQVNRNATPNLVHRLTAGVYNKYE